MGTQDPEPKDPGLTRAEIQKKLHLLHSATGHGPVRHMIQALRRRGVHKTVLEEAERFECSVCKERQRPKPRPRSSFEPLPPKWSTVAADMGTWEHPQTGKSHQFLLVIDEGSRFRIGRVLGEGRKYHVGASQFLETFQECWIQYFGLPDTLRLDPDGTFRSKAVEEYCDRHQIFLDVIPGEAHWKLGTCENAVKGVKELMTRVALDSPEVTTVEALAEATRTFNDREMVRGFSPLQHALGRAPDPTGRVFPRAGAECPDLLMENASGEFQRNLQRMKSAEQAFLDWTAQQRISRAENSKGRSLVDYQPGDLVYVWRQQVSGQSTVKGGAFVGPARVLAVEHHVSKDGILKQGSSVWCVRGRRLWKCSVEQLRMASEKEVLLHELHSPQPETWDFHKIAEQLGGNEYLDVSKDVPTAMEWESAQDHPSIPWKPTHRYAGKRGPSPPPRTLTTTVPMDDRPPPLERSARSRSPHQAHLSSTAPLVNECFFSGEHWYDQVQSGMMTQHEECAFWSSPEAAVEVAVEMPTTRASSERALSDFTAYFVNSFKRRSAIEVSEKYLTAEEKSQFQAAKAVEVSNFIAAKAFEVLPDHLKPSANQAIRMRWILTWKYKDDGSKKAKSRAVLLGYQDPCYEQRATNSPTTTRQTRQIQLQLSASLKFRMHKGDVTGAFLQSRPYPGELYCIPAPEICEAMGLPPESITKVRKACYGLVDAPLEWYRSVNKSTIETVLRANRLMDKVKSLKDHRSPGAAEALAAVNGEDTLFYGRFQLSEMLGNHVDVKDIDATVNKVEGTLVTDSRNVYDKMESETLSIKGAEKRTDLELLALKESQLRNQVKIRWVHGEAQLSNGLTKGNEYKQLELYYSMNQSWRIVEDVERASARRRKALGLSPLEPREKSEGDKPGDENKI
eukprot:s1300_g14.t1